MIERGDNEPSQEQMSSYKHTQLGVVILAAMGVGLLIVAVVGIAARPLMPASIVAGVLALAAILFWNLTIEIADEMLTWSFGPGLIRKSVPLAEIKHVEAVRIHWWNGWGIHLTSQGWLYNVSGWDAVVVQLKSGKMFQLGTDEPQKLVEALRDAITTQA